MVTLTGDPQRGKLSSRHRCPACYSLPVSSVHSPARAVDGDTLNMAGIVVRLHGIDAPELNQGCTRAGAPWTCGREAAGKLATLVTDQSVRCEQRDIDDYGRIVATCRIGQTGLSAAMVDAGLAVALPHFSTFYVANEARARDRRIGLWDSEFQLPGDYRAAHSAPRARPAPPADSPRQSFASLAGIGGGRWVSPSRFGPIRSATAIEGKFSGVM